MLSSEFLRSALEAAPDAMVIVDASGTIVYVNQQVRTVFGYAPEELKGKSVELLMPERFRRRHLLHRENFAVNRRPRPMGAGLELYALRRDGVEFPVEISLSPITDGERLLVTAAIRDVTDRKRIQSELVAAREAADRANQAKSRFLAAASHDLRQPLQTLALLTGSLRRMSTDPELAEVVAQQEQAISSMSRLLNALLDISKLESGTIRPEPTDFALASLFESLRSQFAGLAAEKGLELQVEPCGDWIHSDPSLLEQILRNLVSNAIKYTREGYVRLRCLHEKDVMRIQVVDTGIGIPPDQLPYIYDEFYQVGSPAGGNRDGYGLGLSIVQRLVKLLGLSLRVESEVGKGSTFSLELPAHLIRRRDPGAEKRLASAQPRRQERPAHALLVEDDPAVLSAMRMLLKVEGYRVTTATSPAEALEKAREHPDIDLLITDYHLGGSETGSEVISSLRAVLGAELRAVLVTGDTSPAIKNLKRDDRLRLVSKPINAEELVSLLRNLMAS